MDHVEVTLTDLTAATSMLTIKHMLKYMAELRPKWKLSGLVKELKANVVLLSLMPLTSLARVCTLAPN